MVKNVVLLETNQHRQPLVILSSWSFALYRDFEDAA